MLLCGRTSGAIASGASRPYIKWFMAAACTQQRLTCRIWFPKPLRKQAETKKGVIILMFVSCLAQRITTSGRTPGKLQAHISKTWGAECSLPVSAHTKAPSLCAGGERSCPYALCCRELQDGPSAIDLVVCRLGHARNRSKIF